MASPGRWMALVAKTPAEARNSNIDGPGGIKNINPAERPDYQFGIKRLTWPNGSYATVYSDEEPESLRSFSGDTAWLDEFGKFKNAKDCWDNLQFGMRERSNDKPRILISTTPRPLPVLIQIEAMSGTIVTTGSSYDNRENLAEEWYRDNIAIYEGTRFGRQEIHAEILLDVPGALWTRDNLDANRVKSAPPMRRIVVAIDPAATSNEDSDESGIVVAGLGEDGHGYVLGDHSLRASPDAVCQKAVGAYWAMCADRVVAEVNNGGEWIEPVVRAVDKTVAYKAVHASRGKRTRAEPISALYEQNRVHHVGAYPKLEDQMTSYTSDSKESPDRMDALVWGLTELMLGGGQPMIRAL